MDTAMMNDQDDTIALLRQRAAGDQRALGELWNRCRDRLKRMVRLRLDRRLLGRLDPSGVLQEAFEELSNVETAAVLGIDPSAASSRHVRAVKRLRQDLKSRPGFFDDNR
jgi:DNA-directed RNA polymerase specialized sigma24 family protein